MNFHPQFEASVGFLIGPALLGRCPNRANDARKNADGE